MDYWQYYGFSRMPFGEGADREVFFRSETHKEALALMLYGIRERKGYIVIIGQQGMGKTTLIRQVMDQLDERTRVALISKSHDLGFTFLKELMEKLGLRTKGVTKGSMLHELYEFLIQCLKKGENIVVFLDDAHRMKDEIIEEVRLMSNFQTSRTKLIQIVIAGEPELDRRLNSMHMRQIRQRIQILHRLLPLGQDESLQYIEHRLACAGGSSGDVFTPEALASICKYAGGIPQNINTLCDHTLTLGAERSEKPISAGTVAAARKTVAPLDPADIAIAVQSRDRKIGPSVPLALRSAGRRGDRGFPGKLLSGPYRRPAGVEPKSFRCRRGIQGAVPRGNAAARPAGRKTGNPACSPCLPGHGSGQAGADRRECPCQRGHCNGGGDPYDHRHTTLRLRERNHPGPYPRIKPGDRERRFHQGRQPGHSAAGRGGSEALETPGRIVQYSCRHVHDLS